MNIKETDRNVGARWMLVLVIFTEVYLNTGHSSAVPQSALLVFEINLEYLIYITIFIISVTIITNVIFVRIRRELLPACSACQS